MAVSVVDMRSFEECLQSRGVSEQSQEMFETRSSEATIMHDGTFL